MTDSQIAEEADDLLRIRALGGDLLSFAAYYLGRDRWGLRREMYDHIVNNRKAVLTVPMGHGKSTTITETLPVALPCWYRDIRIIVGSEATTRAVEAVRWVRNQLEYNPRITEDFGTFRGQPWQEGKFTISGRSATVSHPTCWAVGMDSSVLGGRCDVIILDDIETKKNTSTPYQQKKTLDFIDTTIQSRLDAPRGRPWPWGSIWVNGNLFSPRGPLATLMTRTNWQPFVRSAYIDEDRTIALLPELWSVEDLEQRRLDMGPFAFELAYMNNPGGMADAPFPPEWFRWWTQDPSRCDAEATVVMLPPRSEMQILQGWDLAASRSERADWSVCATAGIHRRTARIFWLEIWRGHVEPYELLEQIFAQYQNHKPERIAIESNGFQLLVAQAAARLHPDLMRVIWPTRTPSDRSKVDRIIAGLQPSFARHAHHFAEIGMEDATMEIQHFPSAPNDDIPDACDITLRDVGQGMIRPQTPVGLAISPPT